MSDPETLFVYGSLAPGGSAHHMLKDLPGTWSEGAIHGKFYPNGTLETEGYPVVDLVQTKDRVNGHLFISEELKGIWDQLDEYEGDGYKRTRTSIFLEDGKSITAYAYVLKRKRF